MADVPVLILTAALTAAALLAAWLLVERSRLGRALASAEAERDESRDGHREAERQSATLSSELAGVNARLSDMGAAHADTLRRQDESHRAALAREQTAAADRDRALRAEFEQRVKEFRAVIEASAADALKRSGEQLLRLATERFSADQEKAKGELEARKLAVESMVKPIAATLEQTRVKLEEIDRGRVESAAQVSEQIGAMRLAGEALKRETANLVQALRSPQVRGRYGEIQLARVAEVAGMREYCDLAPQQSVRDADGRLLRPDLIVKLPNDRCIVVDAKTNIDAYMQAIQSQSPDEADAHLDSFARHVSEQAKALSDKKYWSQFDGAPDFTVMFIPGDQFIDAALQRRPDLLDTAAQHNIILASPSTLIGLLRAVAVGWREKKLSDSANELFKLGRELHQRSAKILGDIDRVGRAITQATNAHNELVASVDARLVPTLRKFEERDAHAGEPVKDPSLIEVTIVPVRSLPVQAVLMPRDETAG